MLGTGMTSISRTGEQSKKNHYIYMDARHHC